MRKDYLFDLEVKGQHRIGIMIVRNTSSYVIHACAKYGKPMTIQQKVMGGKQNMSKPFKYDLKINVQGCIRIMNVCDTSSHGETPMCQIL